MCRKPVFWGNDAGVYNNYYRRCEGIEEAKKYSLYVLYLMIVGVFYLDC